MPIAPGRERLTTGGLRLETKSERERRIFEWFARAASLQVVGEIQQPDPPDVIADVEGLGRVAFELVCVDAQSEHFKHEKFRKTDTAMEGALAALPEASREVINRNFADAEITVQLPEDVHWKAVSLQPIWDILEKLPAGFEEEVRCPGHVAEFLWIYRNAGHKGPTFSTLSGGWVPNINLVPVVKKFAKKYVTQEPLELLAYSQLHDIAHLKDYDAVEAVAQAGLRGSSFRKLWLFDGMLRKLEMSVAIDDAAPGGGFKVYRAHADGR